MDQARREKVRSEAVTRNYNGIKPFLLPLDAGLL